MKNNINTFLLETDLFSSAEIEDFTNDGELLVLKKNEYFIQEGQTTKTVAFVINGCLRSYFTSYKNDEVTYCFSFPNNFMTAYSSFLTGIPTEENIQAITETELWIFNKDKILELEKKNINWTIFLKQIAERSYLELEKKIFELQKYGASMRYANLLENQPNYIQKIPLQYLASYLGITARHLSRIRKEIVF